MSNSGLLLFYRNEIIICEQDGIWQLPSLSLGDQRGLDAAAVHYIGSVNGTGYYGAEIDNIAGLSGGVPQKLAELPGRIADEQLEIAFRAFHVLQWLRINRFCSRCGGSMQIEAKREPALNCCSCRHTLYPRISPAIIVAVVRDSKILLARPNHVPLQHYSVLSGFVRPGETMEQAVRREVWEEAGIAVDNIRYFGSQPWPFPDALMVAFTACGTSGKIALAKQELFSAGWFAADALPDIPARGGIARQLIDWFRQTHSQ